VLIMCASCAHHCVAALYVPPIPPRVRHRDRGWLVMLCCCWLLFWLLVWPQTEICEFNDRLAEFKAINCDVVACSIDSKFSHLAWAKVRCI